MAKNRNVADWVAKAEVDFEAARMLSRSRKKGMPDAVCYHCQQCAEKYLKAYLVLHRVAYPKTHDLLKILEMVLPIDALMAVVQREIKFLNPYSIGIRYPGESADREEAKKAIKAVISVREIIRERLGHM